MNQILTRSQSPATHCFRHSGEYWIQLTNVEKMEEFFIMPLSSSDHWMFVSSRGAITAGRRNEDGALFPYYSADKLVDTAGTSGPRTVIHIDDFRGNTLKWEPFSEGWQSNEIITRRISRNATANQLCLEEVHTACQLSFRYTWTFSNRFGFIRDCSLSNFGSQTVGIRLLDGLQNIVPYGIDSRFQLRFSNLGDAYKLNELLPDSRLGVYYVSS
ncbi:MAG: hypothetical protein AAGJ83_00720, partial [Planctomycetota bacterium]